MAIKLIQNSDEIVYGLNQYICDNLEDIDSLPKTCSMGSSAIIIDSGDVYILNSKHEWKKLGG